MAFKRYLAAAKIAALAADDKKASDILLVDVKKTSGVADYYVLASVDSSTQLSAVASHVDRRLREELHLHPAHNDGRKSLHWAALDYGGLVVHVMHREAREFYALERLWEGARRIKWEEKAAALPAPSRRRSAQ
jgi:ribosome-associated protein